MTSILERTTASDYLFALLFIVGLPLVLLTVRMFDLRARRKLAAARTAFVRQVGGSEYFEDSPVRPSFGYFPFHRPDSPYTHYSYAVEFQRSGYDVLLYEENLHKGFCVKVQVRIPNCPELWMEPQHFEFLRPPRRLIAIQPPGRRKFLLATADEHFARMVVDEEVAELIYQHRIKGEFSETVLEHGTARADVRGERLEGQQEVLPDVARLIAFLRALPPRTWDYAKDHR